MLAVRTASRTGAILLWVRDSTQQRRGTASAAHWALQERANPHVKGLSNLQEDVASPMLGPLPTGTEVRPAPPPLPASGEPTGTNCLKRKGTWRVSLTATASL